MIRHRDIWRALDQLAERSGLSTSGLARRAGLDPTAFNRSKRLTADGTPRWPSTESLAKVLNATDVSMAEFVALMGEGNARAVGQRIPVIGYAQAGESGYFDDAGLPVGAGWDEVVFPAIGDPNAYALEISGESMAPAYRDGSVIVVAPNQDIRRGDRVVAKTADGEVMAKELNRRSARRVELVSINRDHDDRVFAPEDLAWMARIVWASQ